MLPGHGPFIPDAMGLLARYVQHRREREAQLWGELISRCSPPREVLVSSWELATALYTQTLERRMHLASQNVFKILVGLCKEGAVQAFVRRPRGEADAAESMWLPVGHEELWNYSYVQLGSRRLEALRWRPNTDSGTLEAMQRRVHAALANQRRAARL